MDDLIDGMLAAQQRDEGIGQAFFLAGPAAISLRDLVEVIARELAVQAPRARLPYRSAWLLSGLVELLSRPVGVRLPIYPRRVEFYAHDYEFDTTKARAKFGFAPKVEIEEGVRRTIAAYREEGLLS